MGQDRRIRRLGLIALVLAVALAVGLVRLARTVLDPAMYRQVAVAQIEGRLHRPVTIGAVGLAFWPRPGLRVRDLIVARRPPASGPPLLAVAALRVHVRLLPLLARRMVVDRVDLERPVLTFERDAQGRLDVADLVGDAGPEPGALVTSILALFVSRVRLQDGELTFVDRAAAPGPLTTRLGDLDVEVEPLVAGRESDFSLAAVVGPVEGGGRVALAGRIGPAGEAGLPLEMTVDARAVDLGALRVYLPAPWDERVRGGLVTAALEAERRAREDLHLKGTVRVEGGELRAGTLRLAGTVDGSVEGKSGDDGLEAKIDLALAPATLADGALGIAGRANLRGSVHVGRNHLDGHLFADGSDADCRHGSAFRKPVGTPLVVEGDVVASVSGVRLRHVAGVLGGNAFRGSVEMGPPTGRAGPRPLTLALTAEDLDLGAVAAVVPAAAGIGLHGRASARAFTVRRVPGAAREWQPTGTLHLTDVGLVLPLDDGRAHALEAFTARVRVVPDLVSVEEGRASLNGVALEIRGEAREFATLFAEDPARPRATLRVAATAAQLDVDRLLAPAGRARPARDGRAAPPAAANAPGARPLRRRFVLAPSELAAAQAVYKGVAGTRLRAVVGYDDPTLRLETVDVTAAGGSWSAAGTVTVDPATPGVMLTVQTHGVRVEDLSTAVSGPGKPPRVFGLLDLDASLQGWGTSLAGAGRLAIRQGRLPGFNVLEVVTRALLGVFARVVPVKSDVSFAGENTFDRFDAYARLRSGRLATDDVKLVSTDYVLTGRASAGLDGTLDCNTLLALTPRGTQRIVAMGSLPIPGSSYLNLPPIPVRITGVVGNPTIRPDVSGVSVRGIVGGVGGAVGGAVRGGGRLLKDGVNLFRGGSR